MHYDFQIIPHTADGSDLEDKDNKIRQAFQENTDPDLAVFRSGAFVEAGDWNAWQAEVELNTTRLEGITAKVANFFKSVFAVSSVEINIWRRSRAPDYSLTF